jgi:anti-sigma B factor antagonist
MLSITPTLDGNTLTLALAGRLDTDTSADLDDAVSGISPSVTNLVIDMDELEYVSSSGLRALLVATKMMRTRGGDCTLTNVAELIIETFDMTGLLGVFTIV